MCTRQGARDMRAPASGAGGNIFRSPERGNERECGNGLKQAERSLARPSKQPPIPPTPTPPLGEDNHAKPTTSRQLRTCFPPKNWHLHFPVGALPGHSSGLRNCPEVMRALLTLRGIHAQPVRLRFLWRFPWCAGSGRIVFTWGGQLERPNNGAIVHFV